jgi:hypothetical protein
MMQSILIGDDIKARIRERRIATVCLYPEDVLSLASGLGEHPIGQIHAHEQGLGERRAIGDQLIASPTPQIQDREACPRHRGMCAQEGQHVGINRLVAVWLGIIQMRNLVVLDTRLMRGYHTCSTSHVHYRLTKDW